MKIHEECCKANIKLTTRTNRKTWC